MDSLTSSLILVVLLSVIILTDICWCPQSQQQCSHGREQLMQDVNLFSPPPQDKSSAPSSQHRQWEKLVCFLLRAPFLLFILSDLRHFSFSLNISWSLSTARPSPPTRPWATELNLLLPVKLNNNSKFVGGRFRFDLINPQLDGICLILFHSCMAFSPLSSWRGRFDESLGKLSLHALFWSTDNNLSPLVACFQSQVVWDSCYYALLAQRIFGLGTLGSILAGGHVATVCYSMLVEQGLRFAMKGHSSVSNESFF